MMTFWLAARGSAKALVTRCNAETAEEQLWRDIAAMYGEDPAEMLSLMTLAKQYSTNTLVEQCSAKTSKEQHGTETSAEQCSALTSLKQCSTEAPAILGDAKTLAAQYNAEMWAG